MLKARLTKFERGIMIGLILSIPCWLLIIYGVFWYMGGGGNGNPTRSSSFSSSGPVQMPPVQPSVERIQPPISK